MAQYLFQLCTLAECSYLEICTENNKSDTLISEYNHTDFRA